MEIYNLCFMGILSCNKYSDRRDKQELSDSPFEYKYFVGKNNDVNYLENENVILLDCDDNYESLPIKVKKMLEWILKNRPEVEYIFKTDDDIVFDFNKLKEQFINIKKEKKDYCGHVVNLSKSQSYYHLNKCEDESLNKPIDMMSTTYCSGGGYFLSKKSTEIVINQIDKYKNIFEDYSVGRTLNENNIYPHEINLYNNSCFW